MEGVVGCLLLATQLLFYRLQLNYCYGYCSLHMYLDFSWMYQKNLMVIFNWYCRLKLWLFLAYVISFVSLAASVGLLIQDALVPSGPSAWTGVAGVLQCVFVLIRLIIFLTLTFLLNLGHLIHFRLTVVWSMITHPHTVVLALLWANCMIRNWTTAYFIILLYQWSWWASGSFWIVVHRKFIRP